MNNNDQMKKWLTIMESATVAVEEAKTFKVGDSVMNKDKGSLGKISKVLPNGKYLIKYKTTKSEGEPIDGSKIHKMDESVEEGKAVNYTLGNKPDKDYSYQITRNGKPKEGDVYHSLEDAQKVIKTMKKTDGGVNKFGIKRLKKPKLAGPKGKLPESAELDEGVSDFFKKFKKKFGRAFWFSSFDEKPQELMKELGKKSDEQLLWTYDHWVDREIGPNQWNQMFKKLLDREVKRRFGMTPKGANKPFGESDDLDEDRADDLYKAALGGKHNSLFTDFKEFFMGHWAVPIESSTQYGTSRLKSKGFTDAEIQTLRDALYDSISDILSTADQSEQEYARPDDSNFYGWVFDISSKFAGDRDPSDFWEETIGPALLKRLKKNLADAQTDESIGRPRSERDDQEDRDEWNRDVYGDDYDEDDLDEGYTVLPAMDRERYGDREHEGLEGPIQMRNGSVVYYDKSEGKYYDPDTDMYLSDEEYFARDRNSEFKMEESTNEEDLDEGSKQAAHKMALEKLLKAIKNPNVPAEKKAEIAKQIEYQHSQLQQSESVELDEGMDDTYYHGATSPVEQDQTRVSYNNTKTTPDGKGSVSVNASAESLAELQQLLQLAGLDPETASHTMEPEQEPDCGCDDMEPEMEPEQGPSTLNYRYETDKDKLIDVIKQRLQQKLG